MNKDDVTFNEIYSECYDLLYGKKDYKSESEYILKLANEGMSRAKKSLLELGCGTGRHAVYFKQVFSEWTGVDLSASMLKKAQESLVGQKNCEFIHSDIMDLNLNKKFDLVLSLFHVASYQTSNAALELFFKKAASSLSDQGLFIFDFWYGPAVLSDRPQNKVLNVSNEKIKLTRMTTPKLHVNDNCVDVHFKIDVEDRNVGKHHQFEETHRMRYLFNPEIEHFAAMQGLKIVKVQKWMSEDALSDESWYGVAILKK